MRTLLNKSKKTPVNCAIGIGPRNAGLIILHRTQPPKTLEKALKKGVPEAKGTRWGTVSVDPAVDAKRVSLTLNKAATGMGRRLVKTLKGTGFSKVDVGVT